MSDLKGTNMKHTLTASLLLAPWLARAHEGHGLPGASHWHAGDVALWVGVAAVALAVWLARRGR